MARYTGPKHRIARREGENIIGKTSRSLDRRLNIPPGVHGKRGRRKLSEYGIQLREKQKLKRTYGLMEKQFRKYVRAAEKKRENSIEALIQLLESRLDNVVYRLGFAKSRSQARQLVSHRHVLVNGQKVSIPSFTVKAGDKIVLSDKYLKNEVNKANLSIEEAVPEYLERKKEVGRLVRLPTKDEVSNPVDYQLVIEFYSR